MESCCDSERVFENDFEDFVNEELNAASQSQIEFCVVCGVLLFDADDPSDGVTCGNEGCRKELVQRMFLGDIENELSREQLVFIIKRLVIVLKSLFHLYLPEIDLFSATQIWPVLRLAETIVKTEEERARTIRLD